MDLRKEVQSMIHRAIDSSKNYTGDEYEQNQHNWIQITTDRVLAAVMQSLPEPIDIKGKYETDASGGIFVNIGNDESPAHNNQQLEHLALYQSDQGWNHFYAVYTNYLRSLYTIPESVVQSEHDDSKTGYDTGETDKPNDKEPSKVR